MWQFILGMEKRIHTPSFAMRFGTSLHGMLFTDAFFALRYFVDKAANFNDEMGKLAYALMHNHFQETGSDGSPHGSSNSRPSACRASPQNSDECAEHELVPLKFINGYRGARQQRCILCNGHTVWCCRECTTGPFAIVPVCPVKTMVRVGPNKGKFLRHGCWNRHRANPALIPMRRQCAKRARGGVGSASDENPSYDDMDECEACQ